MMDSQSKQGRLAKARGQLQMAGLPLSTFDIGAEKLLPLGANA
jgi:hypothetical protein